MIDLIYVYLHRTVVQSYNGKNIYRLVLTPWNPSCFEFKFDDAKKALEKLNRDSQQGRDLAMSGYSKQKFLLGQSYYISYYSLLILI